jgi:replicative DNA helicase
MAEILDLSLEAMGVSLPYSAEAEQAVLGAIIVDSRVIDEVGGIILPEHFYHGQNAAIYKEMVLMSNAGNPVDLVTVLDAVKTAGVFGSDEDAKLYLYNIAETVPTISNAASYARIVYEKYLMRSLINACREIIENAGGQESASTLLDFAEQRIYEIRAGRDNTELWQLDSVLLNVIDHLSRLSGPDRDRYKGVPTGYGLLDKALTGLNRSDLIILAARPGVGKTSLALNISTNVAVDRDISVAFFSLEMTKMQLAQRVLSSVSGVESAAFRTGDIRPDQWSSIAEATGRLSRTGIFIDDTSVISVQEMKAKARRVKNLGLVVVDYLQLMGGSSRESRVNEISDITRAFKVMAKDLDVPVMLLSQLSRDNEKQSRPPRLSDLRDSGSIEQDADVVLFLHRDAALPEADMENSEIQLIVAKNRHGETTRLRLAWDGEHTRFYSSENYLYE